MAGYEFGFLVKQSLGHVTHTKDLVANVAFFKTPVLAEALVDFLLLQRQKQSLRPRVKDFEVTWFERQACVLGCYS
jgi:hypothetical protein